MKVRKISDVSLENLKLGASARKLGKVRCTVSILPETKAFLEKNGNLSGRIDELVSKYLNKELVNRKEYDDVFAHLEELRNIINSLLPDNKK